MRQQEIENRNFPPKSIEEVVKASPCVPPKGIKSVENARDSVKFTVRERSSSHFPPKKKLAKQLVFTEFGLSPIATSSPSLPEVNRSPEQYLSPRSSLTCKSESPMPLPRTNMKASKGTPTGPKQCGCKQSKCLKLYCECFASGAYCKGCNCTECCNIVGNEDLRKAAVEIILERNPHAFKPRIASTPCSPQNGDEENALPLGRNERGCHCKKSKCRKRYCECFQANVYCSENCKCVGCKNLEACKDIMAAFGKDDSKPKICKKSEGCEGRITTSPRDNGSRNFYSKLKVSEGQMAVTVEDCIDTKIHIQRFAAMASNATGLSDQCLSLQSRKRKHLELDSNEKDSLIESFSDFQKVNNLKDSCPSASFLVEPACHNINSAVVGSIRHPYRLMVANVYHLQETREVCSGLAVLAEAAALAQAAKLFTDKVDKADMKDEREDHNGDTLGDKENDCQGAPAHVQRKASDDLNLDHGATDERAGRILPPGTVQLICNEKHEQFKEPDSPDQILNCNIKSVFAEQEKCVLTSFLDFLKKLITFASIKDDASSCYGDRPVLLF